MFTLAFWKASAERAVKTAAQAVALAIAGSTVGPANLFALDWEIIVGAAGFGAFTSVLTSLGSVAISDGSGPSLAPRAEIAANSSGVV